MVNFQAEANRIIDEWEGTWYEVPRRQELQEAIAAALEAAFNEGKK